MKKIYLKSVAILLLLTTSLFSEERIMNSEYYATLTIEEVWYDTDFDCEKFSSRLSLGLPDVIVRMPDILLKKNICLKNIYVLIRVLKM